MFSTFHFLITSLCDFCEAFLFINNLLNLILAKNICLLTQALFESNSHQNSFSEYNFYFIFNQNMINYCSTFLHKNKL